LFRVREQRRRPISRGLRADSRTAKGSPIRRARARFPGLSPRTLCRVQPGMGPWHAVRAAVERANRGDPDVAAAEREMALRLEARTRFTGGTVVCRFSRSAGLARSGAGMKKDDTHLIETKVSSEAVFDGKLLHVRRDTVRLPDGSLATREHIVHPGAVLVVPVLPDGRLVIERQFRYPLDRVFIEFPAGKRDAGESAEDTARRELREEAGYDAERFTPLGTIHTLISYTNERIDLFVADGLSHVGAKLDDGEFLDIVTMTEDEMLGALDRGEITDAKTVAALLLHVRRRGGGAAL